MSSPKSTMTAQDYWALPDGVLAGLQVDIAAIVARA